ncbi:MAG: hypothetical protein LBM69_00110 [Lachnospiraceae bacterium]|jgi:hypothetical protein|nr:hypothetical protein [Lachnospiraceae bacterium]
MKETRKLYRDDLRQLCIRNNWYTCGDNEEYGKLLDTADQCENVTADVIASLAKNILEHSTTEQEIESICFDIAKICNSFFDQTAQSKEEKYKLNFMMAAGDVNKYAEMGDIKRNRANYGIAIELATVLRDLGHEVEMPVWEDKDYLKIPFIAIDKNRIDLPQGIPEQPVFYIRHDMLL